MFDHSDHHHHHPAPNYNRAFAFGIGLNVVFIIAEIIFGLHANSLALLADAGHNVSDVLGLFIAWGATLLARRRPSERYTYGLQSSSILAALANATLLMVAVGGLGFDALLRIATTPHDVHGQTVMWVAGLGVLINGATAVMFMMGAKDDLNIRGAFLHMLSDAGVSLGVVISGYIILQTGWNWLDPVVSLLIAAAIIWATWGLMRDSVDLALQAVPRSINQTEVRDYLRALEGVKEVHDLHIWAMSTSETALTVHLLMPGGHPGDAFIWSAVNILSERFHIAHATLQIELGDGGQECGLASYAHGQVPAAKGAHSHGHHGHGCDHDH